jgi:GNAT superfamily N-acetyltransferase
LKNDDLVLAGFFKNSTIMAVDIASYSGKAAEAYIDALARLRIEIFRDFPYLYDGNMDYERAYLRTFMEAGDSLLVIAFDGEEIVGASTGLPLEHQTKNVQQPFLEKNFDPGRIFYYGESVLKKEYRGQGIGKEFFRRRETWARQLNRFDLLCFCAVIRSENHPLLPATYRPLDGFWQKQGFERTDLVCEISWKDLEENSESPKSLRFWVKRLH